MKKALILSAAVALTIIVAGCSSSTGGDPGDVNPAAGISGDLTGAVVWSSGTYVSGDTYVTSGASLTIDPGVTVTFASDASLVVEAGGSLSAIGTSAAGGGIVFKNATSAAWDGIYFDDDAVDNTLQYCEVTGVGSGGYAITMDPGSIADIQYCVVHGNGGGGIDARSCANGTYIYDNRFYDNTRYGLAVCDNVSFGNTNSFAAASDSDGPDLSDLYNSVLFSGDIWNADRIFTITEVPYRFEYGSTILADASLYLEPGVTLHFDAGAGLMVMAGGFIVAEGDSTDGVVLEGTNSAASWTGLYFDDDSIGNVLLYCAISGVYGGYAVTLDPDSIADIRKCTIDGNHAGGIDAAFAVAGTVVSNNTFGDNGDSSSSPYDLIYNNTFTPAGNTASATLHNASDD